MGGGRSISKLVLPPEHHISVDSTELKLAIKNRLELEDRGNFDDLCKLMEGVANFDFFDLKQRMRNNFLPFASGARHAVYLQRTSKSLPTTPVLDRKEEEFIADVYEVLRASHFTLLTRQEWELATSENFNLNLPMEVNWDYMDKDLLAKFWASSADRAAIRANLDDTMADRILVFHRGVGKERLQGLLIDQKLDLLMEYTLFYLLDKVKAPLMKAVALVQEKLGLGKKKQPASGSGGGAAAPPPPALPRSQTTRARDAEAAAQAAAEAEGRTRRREAVGRYERQGGALVASRHRFAKTVERNTLARQCPTLLTLAKSFMLPMELQEPTFRDLVVVYRKALPPRKPPAAAANAPNKTKEERMQGILMHRNIHVKVFGETPMADVEMIFPEKVVGIKPFQLANLMVTVVTALVTGALVLLKAGAANLNMNIVWTAGSLVLTRCFTVYTTAQTQRTMLQQQMTSALYDKMQDSQEGVVSVIMEELADQQLKQILLAYMVLLMKDRAVLPSDLDNACEDFLQREFDLKIDYDLDAALPRLKSWGLVRENAQGKLEAMPMTEARAVLEAAWCEAYKCIGKDVATIPTVDMISGAYSVFGEGIDRFVKQQEAAAAAAEADAKRGIMGKATAKARGAFGGIGGGRSGGGGKDKASAAAAAAGAGAAEASSGGAGGAGAASMAQRMSSPGPDEEDAAVVGDSADAAAPPTARGPSFGGGGATSPSPAASGGDALAAGEGSVGGASSAGGSQGKPAERSKHSLKGLFKRKDHSKEVA